MKPTSNRILHFGRQFATALVVALLLAGFGQGPTQPKVLSIPKVSAGGDGTIHVPAFEVPLSSYMSERAKQTFIDQALHPPTLKATGSISEVREAVDRNFYQPRLERAIAIYPVNIAEQKIAAVRTDVVTPRDGVSARNRERVLINLHGGGFAVGAGSGGLAESVPIAGLGKFKVVTVDYRMAPEYKFPAASEDVAMVYKELLRHYKAQNIGIYGCSAGGLLTAETVAWLQKEKLPRPGAIGIFCAGADAAFGGDSRFISGPLDVSLGLVSPPPAAPNPALMLMGYFSNADLKDPEVSPVVSPALLSNFPPTLLITGTRDLALSSAAYTQMQLVSGGVEADLHVWEGMGHNFIVDMDTPEAKEAYAVIVKFFDKHLGCNSRLIAGKAHLQSGCS